MSAIFQTDISTLESQVAALQAHIAAAQERISKLSEAESVADSAIQALQGAVERVSSLAPSAIAKLKQSVLNLFQGGDTPNDGNGNQPRPEPQPNDDGGCEMTPQPNDDGGCEMTPQPNDDGGAELVIAVEPINQTVEKVEAIAEESLTGQHCEWASPWASPLASPLSSWLCCQMEDAPVSVLKGQAVDLAQVASSRDGFKYIDEVIAVEPSITPDTPKEPGYFDLIPVSDAVAYFRNNHTGEIVAAYAGFNSKSKAEKWGRFLTIDYTVASDFELRDAKRLSSFKYEIKLWGLSLSQIQKLADSDLQKAPHSSYGKTSKCKPEPVAPAPKPLQIEDIEPGDIVRSTTINNWQYKVVGIREGMFNCEQINVEAPIKVVMHPASVELISKATKIEDCDVSQHISTDVNDVPAGIELKQTDDALITEYRVWAWYVARVFGKPELQQKCIGSLVESANGINAHRPHGMSPMQPYKRTLDAVKHLVQAAGLKLTGIETAYKQHLSEVAIAAIPAVTPEQAKADLFGGGYDESTPQQQIAANDWVELLVNGDRYQVDSVDSEGIHLVTDDGNMLVQLNEVTLLMKVPSDWQPFQAPANWQPF